VAGNDGCTPDLMGAALCDICRHSNPLPVQFRRFGDPYVGGSKTFMSYCPLWIPYGGSKLCSDLAHSADAMAVRRGESFGSASRCILSDIPPTGYQIPSSPKAVCYAVACEETQLRIRVGSEWSVCQASEAGTRKSVNGWRGQIVCPSHRDMCGDMDDGGPSAAIPCSFPGVLRHNRCVCAPGFLGLDCTTQDSGPERSSIPLGLRYPQPGLELSVGVSLAQSAISAWPFRPTLLHTPVQVSFSVTPPLPSGLHLSSSDGTLSGTPTLQVPRTAYTVFARGDQGGTSYTVFISVVCTNCGPGAPHVTPAPSPRSTTTRSNGEASNGSVDNSVPGGQNNNCYTVGNAGVGSGQRCIFPFVKNGVEHSTCVTDGSGTWCPTKVNDAGVPVRGHWGSCRCTSASPGDGSGGTELVLVLSNTFRSIQANPGLQTFQAAFIDALSAALQWSVGVRSLKMTTSGQLAVLFCAPTPICSRGNDSALAVALDTLSRELQSSGSPLRTSSFGQRYLLGVQLYKRIEAGELSKVWPSDGRDTEKVDSVSNDKSSWWSFVRSFEHWPLALAGLLILVIVLMLTWSLRGSLRSRCRWRKSARAGSSRHVAQAKHHAYPMRDPASIGQSRLPGHPVSQGQPRPEVVGIVTPMAVPGSIVHPTVTRNHSKDEAVLRLMDMGYDFQLSLSALEDNNWSIERAAEALTHPSMRNVTNHEA